MAALNFCLNRRQGCVSTVVVVNDQLQAGYRIQIREQRTYGQIWEGIVDGQQLCRVGGTAGAFVSVKALLNVPADCPVDQTADASATTHGSEGSGQSDGPPVGSGDPNVVPVTVDPIPPVNPPEPPMSSICKSSTDGDASGAKPVVSVIVTDHLGNPISCTDCESGLFP